MAGAVGGIGTSTLAINLAYEIAQKFRRGTILAERSLQVGSLASLLDIHPRVTLAQLLREIHRLTTWPILHDIDALIHGLLGLERHKPDGPHRLFGRVLNACSRGRGRPSPA